MHSYATLTHSGFGSGPQANSSAPYSNSTISTPTSPTMNMPLTMTSIVVVPPSGIPSSVSSASGVAPTRTSTGAAVMPTAQAMAVAFGAAVAGIAAVVV